MRLLLASYHSGILSVISISRAGTSLIISGTVLPGVLGFGPSLDFDNLTTLKITIKQILSIELYRVVQRLGPG